MLRGVKGVGKEGIGECRDDLQIMIPTFTLNGFIIWS
jgi:hypothetical protein